MALGSQLLCAHVPRDAHIPSPSKGCLAVQITRASQAQHEHRPDSSEVTQTVLGMQSVGLQKGVPLALLGFRPGPLGLKLCCTRDQAHTQPGGTAFNPLCVKTGIIFGQTWAKPAPTSSQGSGLTPGSCTLSVPW